MVSLGSQHHKRTKIKSFPLKEEQPDSQGNSPGGQTKHVHQGSAKLPGTWKLTYGTLCCFSYSRSTPAFSLGKYNILFT